MFFFESLSYNSTTTDKMQLMHYSANHATNSTHLLSVLLLHLYLPKYLSLFFFPHQCFFLLQIFLPLMNVSHSLHPSLLLLSCTLIVPLLLPLRDVRASRQPPRSLWLKKMGQLSILSMETAC